MSKQEKILKNNELKTDTNPILSKMYKELNNAINSNNVQSLWKISKTITKYHFRNNEI